MSVKLNASSINDITILSQLRSGDEKAFDMVYRLYHGRLCAFASQYVDFESGREIVQDIMMWLWENRVSLSDTFSLRSYLFTAVKNRALNQLQHIETRRKVHQEIIDKYEEEFSSPDFYMENELMHLYVKALDSLPEDFRKAFEMNRMENLTHKDIAIILNVSPQTVNYRIGQALKILRIVLKDYLPNIIIIVIHLRN